MSNQVAIVGISVELPSGTTSEVNLDHNAFFEFLLSGGQSYEKIPAERFNIEAWKGSNLGQISVDTGSFLKDIDRFDNVEFGVSVKDARAMAPSTRKLLEHSFLALHDSGINYRSHRVGCFTSGTGHDITNVSDASEFDAQGSFAGIPSMIANRISYHLDLRGPSVPSDTACSSTCTALHLAINSMQAGDCEAAVVAGCQLNQRLTDWFNYSQGSVLAKDGKCKPFDASADGFSRAEGVAAIVIKPLEAAIKDGDHVYGTILGTAVNSSGSIAPPNAPVAEAQYEVMLKAFARAGRSPKEVDYFECHATGTAKGDPTEANWVGEACAREDPLLIGSVKGNIGHTEITSFLASLSKVLSIFQHKVIPPNVNLNTKNPAILWDTYKLNVPSNPIPLPSRAGGASLVAINSSGIGGANAHVVVQSPPAASERLGVSTYDSEKPILLCAGGLSSKAASFMIESVLEAARANPETLPKLAVDLGRRARQMTWRTFTVVEKSSLQQVKAPQPTLTPRSEPPIVFVFSGQGPQYFDMGREFFENFPVFRASVLESDAIYKAKVGKSLIQDHGLFASPTSCKPIDSWPIELTLPSIAIFQMALFDLLLDVGVKPDAIVGHSAGETAIMYASGAGSRALTVELAIARGLAFASIEHLGGTMAALSCNAQEAEELIQLARTEDLEHLDPVDIACYNAASAVALAGPALVIDKVLSMASARGISGSKIKTRVPVHSTMIGHCEDLYQSLVKKAFDNHPGVHTPQVSTYSTSTGGFFDSEYTGDYYWQNARMPVLFTESMNTISKVYPDAVVIEISPHPVLSSYIGTILNADEGRVFSAARRPRKGQDPVELQTFLKLLGQLTVGGYNSINFGRVHSVEGSLKSGGSQLPSYPFNRKQFPLYPDVPGMSKQMNGRNGPLNHEYLKINQDTHPSLMDHIIRGEPIMPAAGFLEMALEFGATALMDVKFRSIFSLKSEKPVEVKVQMDGSYWTVESPLAKADSRNKQYTLHADGYLSLESPTPPFHLDISSVRQRCGSYISGPAFYSEIAYALNYGPLFQRVLDVNFEGKEALVKIKGFADDLSRDDYILHPAILDACFHMTCYRPFHANLDSNVYLLPAGVQRVILHRSPEKKYLPDFVYAYYTIKQWKPDGVVYDIKIADAEGLVLCTLDGFETAAHKLQHLPDIAQRYDVVLQPMLLPSARGQCPKSRLFADKTQFAHKNPQTRLGENGVSPTSLPARNHATLDLVDLLHHTLLSLREKKQFVNIFIGGVHDSYLHTELSRLLSDTTLDLTISYFLSSSSQLLHCSSDRVHGELGVFELEKPLESQGVHRRSYDIVLFVDSNSSIDSNVIISASKELLLVGGQIFLLLANSGQSQGSDSETTKTIDLAAWQDALTNSGFSGYTYREHNSLESSHFSIMGEYLANHDDECLPLFDEASDYTIVLDYQRGSQVDLQWCLSGLDDAQNIEVWIIASEGPDADEASGLVRVLQKEFLAWTIRLVIFPVTFSESTRLDVMARLPRYLQNEWEITIAPSDDVLVPRIVSLSTMYEHPGRVVHGTDDSVLADSVSVDIQSNASFKTGCGFFGTVSKSNSMEVSEGSYVIGLAAEPKTSTTVDEETILLCANNLWGKEADQLAVAVPGLIVSALAPSLSLFQKSKAFKRLRVLLTHCESAIGKVVSQIYKARGVLLVEVDQNISLLDLSRLGSKAFDLVVSGYEERSFTQLLPTLLRTSSSRLFLWNSGDHSLSALLNNEPWSIGDALRASVEYLKELDLTNVTTDVNTDTRSISSTESVERSASLRLFSSDKTYLLLGGIGSLGPHLALWMYECGARHIVLTSRLGEPTLHRDTNKWPLRIVEYLRTLPDLDLQLVKSDARDMASLQHLLQSMSPRLGGCFLLTALKADGTFMKLQEQDFMAVSDAATQVMESFSSVVDVGSLDFLFVYSSVTAAFGNGGQSNYSCAKTVVDGISRRFKNALSFVCPPIATTTLVSDGQTQRLSAAQATVGEMIRWVEDAIYQVLSGRDMWYYVPELDWASLIKGIGPTPILRHLIPAEKDLDSSTGNTEENQGKKLVNIISDMLEVPEGELCPEVPLTSYGLDSLLASKMSFSLKKKFDITISQIQLLSNITAEDLLGRLVSHDTEEVKEGSKSTTTPLQEFTSGMREIVERYIDGLPKEKSAVPKAVIAPASSKTFLLTGATGTLGSNILYQLLNAPDVETVYILTRRKGSANLEELQEIALRREGLAFDLKSPTVQLLEYDMNKPNLGLSEEVVEKLLSSVTNIIHNAWELNFTASLSAYEGLIKGTRTLIDFGLRSNLSSPPLFTFISTTGVTRYGESTVAALEAPISLDAFERGGRLLPSDVAGYIQSKWVTELILEHVGRTTMMRISVIRVGQLTGGVSGAWHAYQWFPSVVKSALFVRCLPDADDVVSWIPTDVASKVVVEMCANPVGTTLHLVHPNPMKWHSIIQIVAAKMDVPLVPYAEWFQRLESSMAELASEPSPYGENAALRLLDYLRQGVQSSSAFRSATECMGLEGKVSVERGKMSSATLANLSLPQVGEEDIGRWLNYWRQIGFLPSGQAA